ncbi:MAG: IgGFc-binding protein [Minicystis sp.]
MKARTRNIFLLSGAAASAMMAACAATGPNNTFTTSSTTGDGGTGPGTSGSGGSGGDIGLGGGDIGGGSSSSGGDPTTCADAASNKTYIGCDFWPTVVANNVWSIFDFAVVVANAGNEPAQVTVTRKGNTVGSAMIPPNDLGTIYLPWVAALKGPDADSCGSASPLAATVRATGGAYHLVSTKPVTVYQFNALEYQGAGGPPGKNWNACPGNQACPNSFPPTAIGCFSFSNDASLLLPSTAMTGNYRVTGQAGWPEANIGAYFAVTGTKNGTDVSVKVSNSGVIVAGGGIGAVAGGGIANFSLNEGDVMEIVGTPGSDLSGSLVQATAPVQVITGMPCAQSPIGIQACDHIEESVFPAETLGKDYFVTVPTSPGGAVIGHVVRIYGNVDGTKLSYPAGKPAGAPGTINAGQVVDLGKVGKSFEITGDHEFAVGSFQLGAQLADPNSLAQQKGDPSQSLCTAVEQFRLKYIFLAPADYDENYVDVIQPMTAQITIDGGGAPAPQAIGSGFGVARVHLGPGNGGAHVLTATAPVGIQVMGYGAYTSYQYPGGLNLDAIAPPPPK